jgi:cyclopropane-fatty-acyl-phospholipid synthase
MSILQDTLKRVVADNENLPHVTVDYKDNKWELGDINKKDKVVIKINNDNGYNSLLSFDELLICEAYINNDINFEMEDYSILINLMNIKNDMGSKSYKYWIGEYLWKTIIAPTVYGTAKLNNDLLKTHYSGDYDRIIPDFLDDEYRLYSHGVGYETGKEDLQACAINKLEYIYQTCRLFEKTPSGKPKKVLDVGGGWGSFLKYVGSKGVEVHSISCVQDSIDNLNEIIEKNDLKHCRTTLVNFWDIKEDEKYDAIVIIGVIEHLPYYDKLMKKTLSLLNPGGYVHSDGFAQKYNHTPNSFIKKYIFPGDNTPFYLANYLKAVEDSNYELIDVKCDRLNYYWTCYKWAEKFENKIEIIKEKLKQKCDEKETEKIIRIMRIYLWGSAYSFEAKNSQAYRVVIRKQ